jgi:hypothetical protein
MHAITTTLGSNARSPMGAQMQCDELAEELFEYLKNFGPPWPGKQAGEVSGSCLSYVATGPFNVALSNAMMVSNNKWYTRAN